MTNYVPVPGCELLFAGDALDDGLMSQVLDVQVRDSLLLPDTAVLRFQDNEGVLLHYKQFAIGAPLEVKLAKSRADILTSVFKGEIVAIEPEFTEGGCLVSMRAYDKAWRLNRARVSRTFQDVLATDMVSTVAAAHGLAAGELAMGTPRYPFFQQSMETDWEFCWRLAQLNNCEFVVEDKTFHFRQREAKAPVAELKWGEQLLVFRPRMSGVGQVKSVTVANQDPKSKRLISGKATTVQLVHTSKAVNGRANTVEQLEGGDVVVADRVAAFKEEADSLAQNMLDRLGSTFVEAHGKAYGDPALSAGATVRIGEVGDFSGDYVLTQTTHRFAGGGQYVTTFVISGRTSHTFRDLLRSDDSPDWSSSLVIGIVTNNNDPEGMGRVRVKFPALGPEIEGTWARVLTPNAGPARGFYYLPQVNDEVVVAFEHGDTRRPLVMGSLYNGRDKPPPELIDSASGDKKPLFGVKTPHEAFVDSKQKMTLRSGEKMIVEVKKDGQGGTGEFKLDAAGNVEQKSAADFKETAAGTFTIEGNSVTIKGKGSVIVEATGGLTLKGASVDIQASGPVTVKGSIINLG